MQNALHRHGVSLLILLIIVLYVAVNIKSFSGKPLIRWGDTDVYDEISQAGFTDRAMWVGQKPPTLPLVYRFFRNDDQQIANFQLAVSMISWIFFGLTLTLILENRLLKVLALLAALGLSLSVSLFLWHTIMLSESLSNSLMVLAVGSSLLSIWYLKKRPDLNWRYQILLASGLLLVFFPWGFIRDPNGYFLLGCAGLIAIGLAGAWWKWRTFRPYTPFLITVIIGFIAMFWGLNRTASIVGRWKPSIYIVTAQFILPDPESTAFFVDHGMPEPDSLRQFEGLLPPWESAWPTAYDEWVNSGKARQVYLEYLLWKAPESLITPLKHWRLIYAPDLQGWGKHEIQAAFLEKFFDENVYTPTGFWLISLLFVTILLLSYLISQAAYTEYWLVPLILLILLYPLTFMIWYSSGGHTDRHALTVNLQLRLTVLLFLFLSMDTFLKLRSMQRAWRWASPHRIQTVLLTGIVPLMILEVIFRLPLTRDTFILPAATALSSQQNILSPWHVHDVVYFAYEDNLEKWTGEDAVLVSSMSTEPGRMTLLYAEKWRAVPDREIDDINLARYVRQWQETGSPEFLTTANIEFMFLERSWLEKQEPFQRLALENPAYYELLYENDARLLYRVQDGVTPTTPNSATMGLSEANYEDYLAYPFTLVEPGSVIFSPMRGLDWFENASDIGRLVEAAQLPGEQRHFFYDLMHLWEQRLTPDTLNLNPQKTAIFQEWQATRYSSYLAELGIDYLLVNDLWMSYLTTDEYYVFQLSTHYELVAEWSDNLPGFYRLYRVVSG